MRLKFVDLFCGIGGFHHALHDLGHECVFACDIDKDCREVYQENWDMTVFDDIRKWVTEIDEHDILCAGFPCQPFSKSGSQKGFEDKLRGTLFGEIMKIVKINKPGFILLENVANLRTHDNKNTLKTILSSLRKNGYYVKDKVLSPDQFGIPHHRPRIFIVAINKEKIPTFSKFRFPRPGKKKAINCHVDELYDVSSEGNIPIKLNDALVCWNSLLSKIPNNIKPPSPTWSMEFGRTYKFDIHPICNLTKSELCKELAKEGIDSKIWWNKQRILRQYPPYIRKMKTEMPNWKKKYILNNRIFWEKYGEIIGQEWLSQIRKFSETFQKFEWHVSDSESRDIFDYMIHSRPSGIRVSRMNRIPALVAMSQIPIIGPWGRKISVKEASKAQSFREDFIHHEDDAVSYKQLGNSVNVEVVKEIISRMTKIIPEIENQINS